MLSSTNGSIKHSFLHNYYSSSSFNHYGPPTTISQGSNDIPLNHMICPNSSTALNPYIEMPSFNQEIKADHDHVLLTRSQLGHHNGPPTRRSVRKEYRVKKIYTAQGLRDRRVRLSKEVAHKFFKLQDTLGFDKASKTLEWLLNESGKAIEQLKIMSSTSEEEEKQSPSLSVGGEEKGRSGGLEGISTVVVNRETRAKARERARERTRAKTMSNGRLVNICPGEENCGIIFQCYPLEELPGWRLSQDEYLEDDGDELLGSDGQNPFVVVEAQEVEEPPRSKPPNSKVGDGNFLQQQYCS